MTNPTKRRSSYKITFMDRHGAEGANRLRAAGHALTVFGCSFVMFAVLEMKIDVFGAVTRRCVAMGLPSGGCFAVGVVATIAFPVVFATLFAAAAADWGLRGSSAAGDVMRYVTAGGSSTPYEDQFSHEQALVMKEDYAGAAACFEQRILDSPGDARVLLAAADLYASHAANPARAAQLYRDVQRLPGATPGQDVYASNKMADLYLGPLDQPGRALVEFRRLIQRYPNSRVAEQARMALANLKPDLVKEREAEA